MFFRCKASIHLYGSQGFCSTILNILWTSSSRRTSKLNINLFKNVSLHISETLCNGFVTVIQYEESFLSTVILLIYIFLKFCSPEMSLFDKRLSSENNQFYKFTGIYVSGLSCRKSDSCHYSY